jgi:starch phosphorylase
MSILNSARSGRFSTDRTMREYNTEIWRLAPSGAACAASEATQAPTG